MAVYLGMFVEGTQEGQVSDGHMKRTKSNWTFDTENYRVSLLRFLGEDVLI